MGRRKLNFLLIERPDGWLARCLEHNFVTQADTLNDLYYEIQRTIAGHIAISLQDGREPFEGMASAPSEYWDIYQHSTLKVGPTTGEIALNVLPSAKGDSIEAPDSELRVALTGAG